jgi:hypothetical protein
MVLLHECGDSVSNPFDTPVIMNCSYLPSGYSGLKLKNRRAYLDTVTVGHTFILINMYTHGFFLLFSLILKLGNFGLTVKRWPNAIIIEAKTL